MTEPRLASIQEEMRRLRESRLLIRAPGRQRAIADYLNGALEQPGFDVRSSAKPITPVMLAEPL